jgi:FHA domain-containing protein/zinc ribbon protein
MWRKRRERAQVGSGRLEGSARPDRHARPDASSPAAAGTGPRGIADPRSTRVPRRAWRLDRRSSRRVALAAAPDVGWRGAPAGLIPAQAAEPMNGRLGSDMPSVYCTGCGAANAEGARFCSQCGTPLVRRPGERNTETTSMFSLAGPEVAESESTDESITDAATLEAMPAGTALLVVRRGPNAGSRFLLDSDLTLVGRHPDSDIFLDDVTVSRRHAEFYRQSGLFTVRDVGSLNGTYVNRERIEEADLSGGDEVQVGKFRLIFLLSPRQRAELGAGA